MGYFFIMPFILGFILWFLIPALVAANLTLQKWNLITPARYVGFENFENMFSDPILGQSLKVTFIFSAISVPVGLVFAFFLAAGWLGRYLKDTGINVVTRLLGMLLAALAIQFMIDGLAQTPLFTG